MWIVSIEKLGEKIYGCIDDGVNYHIFSIDPDSSMDYEKSYYKGNYNDYNHFVHMRTWHSLYPQIIGNQTA